MIIYGQEYEVFEGEMNSLFDFLSLGSDNFAILQELNGSTILHTDEELYSFFFWSVVFEAMNRIVNRRGDHPPKVIDLVSFTPELSDPLNVLNIAEVIMESCLLITNTDMRIQLYTTALDLIQKVRSFLEETDMTKHLLRSYHLECFSKFFTMKYVDEEQTIHDVFELGGTIIRLVEQSPNPESYSEYHSLGYVWRAYGLVMKYIHTVKEWDLKERRATLNTLQELVIHALELGREVGNKDRDVLSAYIYAFTAQLSPRILFEGGFTAEDRSEFLFLYNNLFELANTHGMLEFAYLAALNFVRLNLNKLTQVMGVIDNKQERFKAIIEDFAKVDELKDRIYLPHLHFYRNELLLTIYTFQVYFEIIEEEKFDEYVNKALKASEEMRKIYTIGKMGCIRERLEMYPQIVDIYLLKASLLPSRAEKFKYLEKCEVILLEEEKLPVSWSTEVFAVWRTLSTLYLELSKLKHNTKFFTKCVYYAKKAYQSAKKSKRFADELYEVYKIAIVAEDYQDYDLSTKYLKVALQVLAVITQSVSEHPYYEDLKLYLEARLLGVKAKNSHRKGNYSQSVDFYRDASSLLQTHSIYSHEAALYNVYSLFEEASTCFVAERYDESLRILTTITNSFDELITHQAEEFEPHFQYMMDRRAYNQQLIFQRITKTFCTAQSNILQSLIYRNSGDSKKAIELLNEANTLLSEYVDRDVHIAGYSSYTKGLYALELSELAIRSSEYRNAASYLASASDQFASASKTMTADEGLRRLCEGLKSFSHGWMFALEILRRDVDLNISELEANFAQAHQSFAKATKELEIFQRTSNSVSGFEKLLSYFYYSLRFQKTDDSKEKTKLKDKMVLVLTEALKKFNLAEDTERFGFTRDLLTTLPPLEDIRENIFKPISMPFATFTPVFETTGKVEPSGVNFEISVDKTLFEVDEKIRYTIQITSDSSVYLQQIDGVFPKDVKVISGARLAKKGTVKIDRLVTAGQRLSIEFVIRSSTPLHSRKHPQLIYHNTKNEKCRAFTKPLKLRIFPKGVLKSGTVFKIDEKIDLVRGLINALGIDVGEFPVVYHNINSFRETLVQYYIDDEGAQTGTKRRSKRVNISNLPVRQMAFVDPLGEVNILYDLEILLYPRSITSLLNIIIHEKFGHGFFFQHTTIGKKLVELEYHRKGIKLLTKELEKISNKYATGLSWLCMSTIVVDEGFAVWLTLKVFERMLEKVTDGQFLQQIRGELENIKLRAFNTVDLQTVHEYFMEKHGVPGLNPYSQGFYLCSLIEDKYGEMCVPKALEIAADINLTRKRIARMPKTIKNDNNCADKRLEKIARSELEIERNNVSKFEEKIRKLF